MLWAVKCKGSSFRLERRFMRIASFVNVFCGGHGEIVVGLM